MLKVLIVDDEEKVCWLIQKLIDWEGLGLSNIGYALNGAAALDIIEKDKPDIIITDIRMPDIDGMELIRRTISSNFNTSFVVISGHRQFEYAYSAMKFGVEDYLLKPIKKDELNKTLKHICDRQDQKRLLEERDQEIKNSLESHGKLLFQKFSDGLIEGTINDYNIVYLNKEYGLKLLNGFLCGINIHVDVKINFVGQAVTDFICDNIASMVHRHFEDLGVLCLCIRNASYAFALISLPLENYKKDLHLKELFQNVQKYINTFDCYTFCMAVSDMVQSGSDLSELLHRTIDMTRARIVLDTGKIIRESDCKTAEKRQPILSIADKQQLTRAVGITDVKKCKSIIQELFDRINKENPKDYAVYYQLAQELCDLIYFVLEESIPTAVEWLHRDRITMEAFIQNASTSASLSSVIMMRCGILLQQCAELWQQQDTRPIRIAKKYILEHYSEEISLEQLSMLAGLSPSYFSAIFKDTKVPPVVKTRISD